MKREPDPVRRKPSASPDNGDSVEAAELQRFDRRVPLAQFAATCASFALRLLEFFGVHASL